MKIKVNTQGVNKVIDINTQGTNQVVAVGVQGPPGTASSIASIPDVDLTDLRDGSILVYAEETQKWKSSTLLNKQAIDAGEF